MLSICEMGEGTVKGECCLQHRDVLTQIGFIRQQRLGTSLAIQWLRLHLPRQGTCI